MFALEGIRVLDLSRMAPGPFCSMLLGDMGADVLLVEALGSQLGLGGRDGSREEKAKRDTAYNAMGRNKKSIMLDLKTAEGRDILHKLAASADVVMEGFRPGVVKRLGADYDTLREINDRIIYCSLSGYGQNGPYVGLVGHDINYISIGGALGLFGAPDRPPAMPLNIVADLAGGGLMAAYGILLALVAREHTKKGQYVDIALSDGVIQFLAMAAAEYFNSGRVPKRGEHMLMGAQPNYNVYECQDGGWISLGSLEPHFWANLCKVMGREDFIEHENNGTKWPEMRQYFTEHFRTRNRDEWFATLQETDICAAPVYNLDEVFTDPHNLHRNMVVTVDAPGVGQVKQVGIAVKLSETPGAVRHTAPLPGQQTDDVLKSLGYDGDEIAALRKSGAVG